MIISLKISVAQQTNLSLNSLQHFSPTGAILSSGCDRNGCKLGTSNWQRWVPKGDEGKVEEGVHVSAETHNCAQPANQYTFHLRDRTDFVRAPFQSERPFSRCFRCRCQLSVFSFDLFFQKRLAGRSEQVDPMFRFSLGTICLMGRERSYGCRTMQLLCLQWFLHPQTGTSHYVSSYTAGWDSDILFSTAHIRSPAAKAIEAQTAVALGGLPVCMRGVL
jgi:hypothetical protein